MNPYNRKNTRVVNVGGVLIGGGSPISIQSMANTDTRNVAATVAQIRRLTEAGCEIARVAVLDEAAAAAIKEIKAQISVPLVADVHFDYRLALLSMQSGADKLRINPGNIGDRAKVAEVVKMAKTLRIPIRIGVNSGSLEKNILQKHGGVTAEAIVESAMAHTEILRELDFHDMLISVKTSSVPMSIAAYKLLSEKTDHPLHLGITEAGTPYAGSIKSAAGIGAVLAAGIGDTIRVSLTGDPMEEIKCARELLKCMGLRQFGPEFISCPTCGRTEIDLIGLTERVEKLCAGIDKPIKIAVMGCFVNGPGEAKEADIGIAGGRGCGVIFKKGRVVRKAAEDELLGAFMEELANM